MKNMQIHANSFYNTQFRSSYEYRNNRAEYIRNKIDDYQEKSILYKASNGLALIGLLALAVKKIINPQFKEMSKLEKFGYLSFMTGAVINFILMFKRINLSSKYMNEYDNVYKKE